MKLFAVNANVICYFKWCIQFSQVLDAGCQFLNHVSILSAQEIKSVIKSSNSWGLLNFGVLLCSEGKAVSSIIKMHRKESFRFISNGPSVLSEELYYSFHNKTSFMIFLFTIPLFIKVSDRMINVNCDLIDLFSSERALGLSSSKKASSFTSCVLS